ncbi:Hsp90 co-chaperone Cdc37 [Amphibalanus amphitrite]|uniref:Hsp90 co-chaperone Cdc37 n=1 Tax=Amphibalanus amphitrite TaxID=1232801 RepID=A0A6A4X3G9_AMPAM|nr:hsp90 co-chaperone Cdc37-like [Amphibalanus amphitrite]XP_043214737.1 hsp90 co-chaperone Cdc37-like [Amphibalanus amphitrite]KAF0313815.1 Hsp90 co-chaperone Cdc37 [Amphibalanus amphitrite]
MVDYSKWKDIEVSDDEDDTHPNIDTPSLFKWRHEARVQRTKEHEEEKQKLASQKNQYVKQLEDARAKVQKAEKEGSPNLDSLKKSLAEIESKTENIKKEWAEFEKKEKLMPWNVDTISSDGFSKTVINAKPKRKDEDMTEEEREERMRNFIKKYEKDIKKYGMLRKYDDSKRFLQDNMHLACEDTANYLVIWAINLEMEEKHSLMEHVAHQCICMNYILELGKQMDVDPKACVSSFFTKIQVADQDYKKAFDTEVEAFKSRIRTRAKQKVDEAMKEYEEEERQKRLGPGGLDPAEVFESLPEALQKCFETQDTELLQKTISEMDEDEARYHMKRCVDSGLWVADAKAAEAEKAAKEAAEAAAKGAAAAEPVYDEVKGAAKSDK